MYPARKMQLLNIQGLSDVFTGSMPKLVNEANRRGLRLVENSEFLRLRPQVDEHSVCGAPKLTLQPPLFILPKRGEAFGRRVTYEVRQMGEGSLKIHADILLGYQGLKDHALLVPHSFEKDGLPSFGFLRASDNQYVLVLSSRPRVWRARYDWESNTFKLMDHSANEMKTFEGPDKKNMTNPDGPFIGMFSYKLGSSSIVYCSFVDADHVEAEKKG
ncbi:hypothetical protein DRN67_01210 [Candidatus Micrarchaeota archaeon]|nr:MAG: hypothetical protein DRN67_01210 [Candidatus Micrarchaeota archaeon]